MSYKGRDCSSNYKCSPWPTAQLYFEPSFPLFFLTSNIVQEQKSSTARRHVLSKSFHSVHQYFLTSVKMLQFAVIISLLPFLPFLLTPFLPSWCPFWVSLFLLSLVSFSLARGHYLQSIALSAAKTDNHDLEMRCQLLGGACFDQTRQLRTVSPECNGCIDKDAEIDNLKASIRYLQNEVFKAQSAAKQANLSE